MNKERGAISRRDLFHRATQISSPSQIASPDQIEHAFATPLNRRQFAKLSAATVITLADSQRGEVKAAQTPVNNLETADQPETGTSEEKKATLLDTIKESTLLNAGNIVTGETLRKLGVPIGNAHLEQFAKNHEQTHGHDEYERLKPGEKALGFASIFAYIGGLTPLSEEFEFRFIPSFLLSKIAGKGTHWKIGVPVSAAFALYHNIAKDEYGDYKFHKKIPLSQFTMGLYFWKAMRQRGFWHAVTAHGTINTEALTFGFLANETKKIIGKE